MEFAQGHYLDKLVEVTTHKCAGDDPKNIFISSVVKTSWALAIATPASSQTLDERESAFSFSFSPVCYLFRWGGISSIEVVGEAILVVSTPGVTGVANVTEAPLSVTFTFFAPRLDKGSFFLALIQAYILWLNLVVIPARGKHLLKK